MRGIVFLDRDGTLIEDSGYLADPENVREIPGAADALLRLFDGGFALAVVSNQAGMARGILREEQMQAVHRAFVGIFREKGVEFLAVEYCPHHPEGTVEKYRKACRCRKPKDGMARKVLEKWGIPSSCTRWVVGDKMSDVLMGIGIGAKTILVATGYGESERARGESAGVRPDRCLPSIREAASWILGDGK